MLKFHLKSKWKVLTDNHRVEQWSSRLKDPEFCLVGTFLCFLVVFTAFPKILVIGKKVLVRTSPFLTVMLHFWEDKDTSLVLPYVKHKKETGGQQHSQLKPTLQWPLQGPSSAAGLGGDTKSQESHCRRRPAKMWHLSILLRRWARYFSTVQSHCLSSIWISWYLRAGTKCNPQVQFYPNIKLFLMEIS